MSTGSIKHNVVIDTAEAAERFCDALEKAEEMSKNSHAYIVNGRKNIGAPEPTVSKKRMELIKQELAPFLHVDTPPADNQ